LLKISRAKSPIGRSTSLKLAIQVLKVHGIGVPLDNFEILILINYLLPGTFYHNSRERRAVIMFKEELEREINSITQQLNECNQIIAEAVEATKKADKLRTKLKELMVEYLKIDTAKAEIKPLFIFQGKTKDLLKELRQELEKAQNHSPSFYHW
jgi:hypothetical protein